MLPTGQRIRRAGEFTTVMRGGRKSGRRHLVAYRLDGAFSDGTGEPRFGFIVSKAVGNSVVRHRVSRRLRHICSALSSELPTGSGIVIRALPPARTASSAALEKDVRGALRLPAPATTSGEAGE